MASQRERDQGCWSVCAAWVHPNMLAPRLWRAGMLTCNMLVDGQRARGKNAVVSVVCMSHLIGNKTPTFLARWRWVAIDQHASMLRLGVWACWGCTPAAQADKDYWPPSLAGWPSTSIPACQQPGAMACWGAPQQHRQTIILAPLPRWLAIDQHASMPACYGWGCWHAGVQPSSTDRTASLSPPSLSLAGWPSTSMPECQHANDWWCWHAGLQPSSTDRPA